MYDTVVPETDRVGLELSFTVAAAPPGSSTMNPITAGTTLRSGSNLYFSVRPTKQAHVYIYQQDAAGAVNVLFPHPQLPMTNPIAADKEVRIPPAPGTFKLNDKDIGVENVYIVGSLEPLPQLGAALAKPETTVEELGCAARSLEFNAGGTCEGGARGLEFNPGEEGAPTGISMHAKSAAGDNRIVQVFSFRHEK